MNIALFALAVVAWLFVVGGAMLSPFVWFAYRTDRLVSAVLASMFIMVPAFATLTYFVVSSSWAMDTFGLE